MRPIPLGQNSFIFMQFSENNQQIVCRGSLPLRNGGPCMAIKEIKGMGGETSLTPTVDSPMILNCDHSKHCGPDLGVNGVLERVEWVGFE